MENVLNFATDNIRLFLIVFDILFVLIGIWIGRTTASVKKPKTCGELHIIHYPNNSRELYTKLDDDIDTFENEPYVNFKIVNDEVSAY